MKRLLLSFILLGLLTTNAQADYILSVSNPVGSPLTMSPGSTSGLMSVIATSNNPPNDVMAAWGFALMIVPATGDTGVLTFQDPATGTPANPPNYIFGTHGLGISVTNGGASLSANDFFDPAFGSGVATTVGNLLQVDFHATPNAAGLFGIYALEGAANTSWTDSNFSTQLFANVPDGTGMVHLGDVLVVPASIPEPSSLVLIGISCAAFATRVWRRRRRVDRIA
jgi:hypothetical protein